MCTISLANFARHDVLFCRGFFCKVFFFLEISGVSTDDLFLGMVAAVITMELQQLSSWGAKSLGGSLSSPSNLQNGSRSSPRLESSKKKLWRVSAEVEEQSKAKPNQGWFFKNFVAEQTMDAKLAKFKGDVKARNGYVGSWFEDSFKYTAWVEVHRVLTERGLPDVDCKEANARVASKKAILIDVREGQEYEKCHAKGAQSAPLFRLIQGNDTKANLRRLGYALITDFSGTERNPEFVAMAEAAVGGDKKKQIIVYCSVGGTLQTFVERKGPKAKKYNDPERLFGRQSRSLKAIYELQQAGFTNVVHLKGGFDDWLHLDYPLEAVA